VKESHMLATAASGFRLCPSEWTFDVNPQQSYWVCFCS